MTAGGLGNVAQRSFPGERGQFHTQPFVVTETNGVWGSALEVPGVASLSGGEESAAVVTLSCASPGNCGVGGFYTDSSGQTQAFVAGEANGSWGTAQEVPGTGGLNTEGAAQVSSISCASPGDCAAGGYYSIQLSGITQTAAFVADETNGTWGTAQEVPGAAALTGGGRSEVTSVSCSSAGGCAAGGSAALSAFVSDETGGTWGTAQTVSGLTSLPGSADQVNSVSCNSPGNCSAVGTTGAFVGEGFGVTETNGTWGTAAGLPVPVTVPSGDTSAESPESVSCASPGNCAAGGLYSISTSGSLVSLEQGGFLVDEINGVWGTPAQVPGLGTQTGAVSSVSCPAAGYCTAAGTLGNQNGTESAVMTETGGTWGDAQPALGSGPADVVAGVGGLSCSAVGYCSVGGNFSDNFGQNPQAVVQDETPVPPPSAVGVEGDNGQMWVQAPQLGGGWHPLGGQIAAPPAVAAAPNPDGSTPAQPLFIATGAGNALYIRSLTAGWQRVGPSQGSCIGGPAAVISGTTLTVACRGTDNALWYTTATVPATGLPQFTAGWKSLGGVLWSGPAVAPAGGTMTFFARGVANRIYIRTLTSGWQGTGWSCVAAPAAALQAAGSDTIFACTGTTATHALWESVNGGAGWTGAVSLGGSLIGGPGIAAASQVPVFLGEGTDHAVWERTPVTGWTSLGGIAEGGVGAAALN